MYVLSDSAEEDISCREVAQEAKLPLWNVDVGRQNYPGSCVAFSKP